MDMYMVSILSSMTQSMMFDFLMISAVYVDYYSNIMMYKNNF